MTKKLASVTFWHLQLLLLTWLVPIFRRHAAEEQDHQVEHDVKRDGPRRSRSTEHRQASLGHRGDQIVDVKRQDERDRLGFIAEVGFDSITVSTLNVGAARPSL